jgi:predicted amidohydrolase
MARCVRISCVQLPADLPGKGAAEKRRENNRRIRASLAVAGERKSDIVLLAEYGNLPHRGTSARRSDFAPDPIPGPFTAMVASLAKKHKMNVAQPMLGTYRGRTGSYVVLFNRAGKIAGVYLKSHPTEPEQDFGMAAGDALPVFSLDCARVGVMICMDIEYPEVAQALMLGGAEILLFPHVQSGWGEEDWEVRMRARAIDTGTYLASACYGFPDGAWMPGKMLGRSGVIGPDGLILADIGRGIGVITRDIDLDEKRITHFFFHEHLPRTAAVAASRRPELYGALSDTGLKRRALAAIGKRPRR